MKPTCSWSLILKSSKYCLLGALCVRKPSEPFSQRCALPRGKINRKHDVKRASLMTPGWVHGVQTRLSSCTGPGRLGFAKHLGRIPALCQCLTWRYWAQSFNLLGPQFPPKSMGPFRELIWLEQKHKEEKNLEVCPHSTMCGPDSFHVSSWLQFISSWCIWLSVCLCWEIWLDTKKLPFHCFLSFFFFFLFKTLVVFFKIDTGF